MKKTIVSGLIATAALFSFPVKADDTVNLSVGSEYTSGKYGAATSTDIKFYPVTVNYQQDQRSFSLIVPYMQMAGPSNIVGAIGNQSMVKMLGVKNVSRRTSSGLGDIVVAATQDIYINQQYKLIVDLVGNVKFGTADAAKGLGTGENDYSVQGDFAKNFEHADMFGTVGWRKMGNPVGINFRNPWFASIGGGYAVSETTRIGLAYDFRQRVIDGTSNFAELLAFINYSVANQARIQMYFLKGYTDNSPDRGVGATLNWNY